MSDQAFIKTRVEGRTGIIELDRPKALNSLTHEMVRAIDSALEEWAGDDSIATVIVQSTAPRAFCAGGDVRSVRESDLAGDLAAGDAFFDDEYAMNLRMAQYPKPIVALLEGVVMGGGFGISAHGSHRVVTPRTVGAMPEAAIGFVPDVGMSYVLNNLPVDRAIGLFIGCTGWRLTPADMLFTGLGNVLVDDVTSVADGLRTEPMNDVLARLSMERSELEEPESLLEKHQQWIVETFSEGSWVEIEERIASAEPRNEDEEAFLEKVRECLKAANPASLVAMVELFRRNAETDVATALKNELEIGSKLRREPNFAEGVRAVLVDKDHDPHFEPDSARNINPQEYAGLLD